MELTHVGTVPVEDPSSSTLVEATGSPQDSGSPQTPLSQFSRFFFKIFGDCLSVDEIHDKLLLAADVLDETQARQSSPGSARSDPDAISLSSSFLRSVAALSSNEIRELLGHLARLSGKNSSLSLVPPTQPLLVQNFVIYNTSSLIEGNYPSRLGPGVSADSLGPFSAHDISAEPVGSRPSDYVDYFNHLSLTREILIDRLAARQNHQSNNNQEGIPEAKETIQRFWAKVQHDIVYIAPPPINGDGMSPVLFNLQWFAYNQAKMAARDQMARGYPNVFDSAVFFFNVLFRHVTSDQLLSLPFCFDALPGMSHSQAYITMQCMFLQCHMYSTAWSQVFNLKDSPLARPQGLHDTNFFDVPPRIFRQVRNFLHNRFAHNDSDAHGSAQVPEHIFNAALVRVAVELLRQRMIEGMPRRATQEYEEHDQGCIGPSCLDNRSPCFVPLSLVSLALRVFGICFLKITTLTSFLDFIVDAVIPSSPNITVELATPLELLSPYIPSLPNIIREDGTIDPDLLNPFDEILIMFLSNTSAWFIKPSPDDPQNHLLGYKPPSLTEPILCVRSLAFSPLGLHIALLLMLPPSGSPKLAESQQDFIDKNPIPFGLHQRVHLISSGLTINSLAATFELGQRRNVDFTNEDSLNEFLNRVRAEAIQELHRRQVRKTRSL